MIELILASLAGTGAGAAAWEAFRRWQTAQKRTSYESLYGIRAGVWIRQPNGSEHLIQNAVEQALSQHGMALHLLHRDPVEQILRDGKWNPKIADKPISVAVIGRIIAPKASNDTVPAGVSTRQHIHTPSGRYFHEIPIDEGGREPNCTCEQFDQPEKGKAHYCEPWNQYMARQERERGRTIIGEGISLDVRFFGPDGAVRGGFAKTAPCTEGDQIGWLVNGLVRELAATAKTSIAAHAQALAAAEAYGFVQRGEA